MRASKVTQYGIPTSRGGRACSFEIGNVRVFVDGPESNENAFVADSLVAYWNADEAPESVYTSDAECVAKVAAHIVTRGVLLSPRFSVGHWTPAIDDGWSWAVLDKQGSPLLLAHDAFEAALYFCRLEEGSADEADGKGGPYRLRTDAELSTIAAAERAHERGWA